MKSISKEEQALLEAAQERLRRRRIETGYDPDGRPEPRGAAPERMGQVLERAMGPILDALPGRECAPAGLPPEGKCPSCGTATVAGQWPSGRWVTNLYCQPCVDREDAEREQAKRRQRLLACGLTPAQLRDLGAVQEPTPEQAEALRRWQGRAGDTLVLTGPVGRGKTLAAAMLVRRHVLAGRGAYFAHVPAVLEAIKRSFDRDGGVRGDELDGQVAERRILHAGVVAIDDLGAERATEWTMERLALWIHARLENLGATIITTNLRGDELVTRLDERMASRLEGMMAQRNVIVFGGPDRRRRAEGVGDGGPGGDGA